MLSLISSSIKANCEHSLRELQSQRIKSTVSVSLSSLSSIHCELGRCVNGIGESSECVASSGCHHHHRSSLRHHQNGVVSGVLRRSLTMVLELLKCSVCFDFMYSPIYQCHNGHTLCSSCKARALSKCPSCMQQLGDIRCLALEKMAMSLELHCKYEEFGCPEIIPYYTKCIHEDCVTSGHTAVHVLDGSALLLGYSIPCFSPDRLSQGRHDL